jgi:hypothetical protein
MEFFPSPDQVWFAFRKSIWIGLGLLVVWVLWEAAQHAFFKWFNEQLARRVGTMTATIIKWTKNHPLYFLMAIMVSYCFIVVVGAQLFVSKKPIENKIPDKPISGTAIPAPPQKLSELPSENTFGSPTTNFPQESLSPEEISRALNTAPILQESDIAKHYIGLKVIWEGGLYNIGKNGDIYVIGLSPHGGGRYIGFQVDANKYPGLGLLKRGAPIKVEGIISEFRGIFIQLKDVTIISY